jgi:hypothetical protein
MEPGTEVAVPFEAILAALRMRFGSDSVDNIILSVRVEALSAALAQARGMQSVTRVGDSPAADAGNTR